MREGAAWLTPRSASSASPALGEIIQLAAMLLNGAHCVLQVVAHSLVQALCRSRLPKQDERQHGSVDNAGMALGQGWLHTSHFKSTAPVPRWYVCETSAA